jgi:hypothetical protein
LLIIGIIAAKKRQEKSKRIKKSSARIQHRR